jgi:Uri superfamily endonuclease
VVLEIVSEVWVTTGRLGQLVYPPGGYLYIGSAMGGISGRIKRYLGPAKRPFWHIDYLLPLAQTMAIVVGETSRRVECALARTVGRDFAVVRRFGSSDCRCPGHLFHGETVGPLIDALTEALRAVGCRPRLVLDRAGSDNAPLQR